MVVHRQSAVRAHRAECFTVPWRLPRLDVEGSLKEPAPQLGLLLRLQVQTGHNFLRLLLEGRCRQYLVQGGRGLLLLCRVLFGLDWRLGSRCHRIFVGTISILGVRVLL